MRTKTKALALALCAVLLVVTTVFVTMAFLTSQDSVKNTFTVGNVAITLDELDVDDDANKADNVTAADGTTRDKANQYKLIPGKSYTKDPTIHVDGSSESCWLFVKVQNGLENAEAAGDTTIAAQMKANGWNAVAGESGVYAYENIVPAGADVADVIVFKSFTIAGDADVKAFQGAAINVTAYAVQSEGFKSAAEAWASSGFSSMV